MNVYEIITENKNLNEKPVGMVKRGLQKIGAYIGSGAAAASDAVAAEANKMAKELKAWMSGSGLKKLTIDDLENFLDQKGYGGVAEKAIASAKKKSNDTASAIGKASKALGNVAGKVATGARASANVAANIPLPNSMYAEAVNPKIKIAKGAGQLATASDGAEYVWAGAMWINNASAMPAKKAINQELGNPADQSNQPLTPKEIDLAILAAVQMGYKTRGVSKTKGRFGIDKTATGTGAAPAAAAPNDKAIKALAAKADKLGMKVVPK